ncbi:MAG: ATP-binding protein [Planctomycetota bacterium]
MSGPESSSSLGELQRAVEFCGRTTLVLIDPSETVIDVLVPGELAERALTILGRNMAEWLGENNGVHHEQFALADRDARAVLLRSKPPRDAYSALMDQADRTPGRWLDLQRMETAGRFAVVVAHDFNNLLTVIGTYAELLATSPIAESQRKSVQAILEATIRSSQLTLQLRLFGTSRPHQVAALSVNEVLDESRSLLECIAGKEIEVEIDLGEGIEEIHVDRGSLCQVIFNLFSNACHAMPDGGRMAVQTRQIEARDAAPQREPRRHVAVEFRDTGIGMSEDVRKLAFNPFFTTKPVGEGTGLGLTIAERIVRGLGGAISMESNPSAGTTVRVLFPIACSS